MSNGKEVDRIIHVTRTPFFNVGSNPPKLGMGGVEVAVGVGGKGHSDMALTLKSGVDGNRWTVSEFDKRTVAELGMTAMPEPVRHQVAEHTVSPKDFADFRNLSIGLWWVHHGMVPEFLTDARELGLVDNLPKTYGGYRRISGEVAQYIEKAGPVDKVIIQDPYYFAKVADVLKRSGNEAQLIGANHIPFPSEADFGMLEEVSPENWRRLAQDYLKGWAKLDRLSVHTQEDAEAFMQSADAFGIPSKKRPELIVNPLGVDSNMINNVVENISAADRERLLDLVLKNADGMTLDDLRGKIIGASIGYRSDPIKQINLNLQAIDTLIHRRPDLEGKLVYVQQVRPHRVGEFASYRGEYSRVQRTISDINRRHGREGWQPIVLIDEPLSHEDVLGLQKVLAENAVQYFSSVPSIEGMNLAGQEALFASSRPDTGLVTTFGSGLGRTLNRKGVGELTVKDKQPCADDIADVISKYLDMSPESATFINRRMREIIDQMPPDKWLENLLAPRLDSQPTKVAA